MLNYKFEKNNIFFYLRNAIEKSKENAIKKFCANCDTEEICPISQDVITNPVKLNCDHIFDESNIIIWLKQNNSCPLCRKLYYL